MRKTIFYTGIGTKKCAKTLRNKMFKCNLDQYIEFSGLP
jgi:hypothetical protein